MPLGHALEAELRLLGFLGWHFIEERGEFPELPIAFFHARNEPLADEPGDEGLEFEAGGIGPGSADHLSFHGSELLQRSQRGADRSHADPDAPADFLHRQGHRRAEEDGVGLAVRARIAKKVRQLAKNGDQALFKALLLRRGAWGILDDGFWILNGEGSAGARWWILDDGF